MICLTQKEFEFMTTDITVGYNDPLPDLLIKRGLLLVDREDYDLIWYEPTSIGKILIDIYKKGLHVVNV